MAMKNKPILLGSEVKKLQDLPHFTIPVDVSDNCEFAGLGKEIHVFVGKPPKESITHIYDNAQLERIKKQRALDREAQDAIGSIKDVLIPSDDGHNFFPLSELQALAERNKSKS